ncbi:MAG: LytTR family DNA-binding domain-containing protein [Eubacteriales bacterium]
MLSIYTQTINPEFEYHVHSFVNAESLLSAYNDGVNLDIILLDIYMGDMSGVTLARELRKLNYKGQIIFITSSESHALAAFEVDATHYLTKPITQELFDKALTKAISYRNVIGPKFIILRSGGHTHKVNISDIMYSEANGHYQVVYLQDKSTLSVRSTSTAFFDLLDDKRFGQVGKSYILNFDYIKKISSTEVFLINDCSIFIPKVRYQKLKEDYFNYYELNDSMN